MHTLITFNAETVKQILRLDRLAGDSSVVHTRPYGVVCDLVKRYQCGIGGLPGISRLVR